MTKFNPDFWETTLDPENWVQFTTEDGLWFVDPEDAAEQQASAAHARALWPAIHAIIEEELTPRQREVVLLYYFGELNQRRIAERLGITQQSISEILYGKVRDGHAVGGALQKLRKACRKRGIRW